MRDCRDSIFLTLVVASIILFQSTLSLAAPSDELKPSILREPIQDVSDPSLSEAALQSKNEDQIFQAAVGIISGHVNKELNEGSQITSGFTYDWRDSDQNYWSLSAKWLSTKAAWVEAGKKFLILPENLNEPYYKLSLSHFMDPDDSLAGLTRMDSFKTSVSFGFLDLFTLGRILNLEVGAHWGIPGFAFHAQTGLQWSF